MPFFKELRRRSKASFRTEKSSNGSSNDSDPTQKSSSTLSSVYGSATPPSTVQTNFSTPNLVTTKSNGSISTLQRPPALPSQSNRYSISGLGSPSINGSPKPTAPSSPYAPRIISITENTFVHQKVLLVYGQIGDAARQPLDGNLTVWHHQDSFPQTNWPVNESHFKVLVHLTPGRNSIRFDFSSPKVVANNSSIPAHSSWLNVHYLPLISSPPLQLVVLLAKDSPATFDAMPERIQREGNGLEIACRKFRMAAHLWQAFTAEQMHRNKLGRRSFRFEEEWQTGTLSYRDRETAQMRNETRIHVVRMDKTVQEVGELAELQRGELHNVAKDAIQAYFRPMPCQKQYVSALVLDVQSDIILDPSADNTLQEQLGGEINLAIFGSHSLQNYPSSIDEIVPAFSDCTRTSMEYVANGDNGSGSNWESANVAMAAQLRATGRIFGCPYEESGIMSHEIVQFNRTFTCKEPYSTRTKSPGIRLCLPKDEAVWHRLDCLRFRHHPCFRIPVDQGMNSDGSVQVWPVENGNVIATATTGIAFIEILTEGDDTCRYFIDYIEGSGNGNGANGPSRQILLTEGDIRARTPEDRKKERLKLIVHSAGQGKYVIEDFRMLASKSSTVKLPNGRMGFRGIKLGMSQIEGSQPQQMMLDHFMLQTKLLTQIKVYYGFAVAGIEFVCEDFTSQLFGQRGGQMSEFLLDTRRGEILTGFYLRAGEWIDGIEILTSLGRRSSIFGDPKGGSGYTLIPPRGYNIAGVSGSCGAWIDGFSLIITR